MGTCGIAGGDALQLIEVAGAHDSIGIALLQMRLIPLPHPIELCGPIAARLAEPAQQLDEVTPGTGSLRRRCESGERREERALPQVLENLARSGGTDAIQHLHHAK